MTLITNYPTLKMQVHDLRRTINIHSMIPEFHNFSRNQRSLYGSLDTIIEYNKGFITKVDNIKPKNPKVLYKLLDIFLELSEIKELEDNSNIKIKFQRRKSKAYISEQPPSILFPTTYKKVAIFNVNNYNITNNVYEFMTSRDVTDTMVNIAKFELSPGFLCLLNSPNVIEMTPSSIVINDHYDDGYEDTIILSYTKDNN